MDEQERKISLEDVIYNAEQRLRNADLDRSEINEQELIIKATRLYQAFLSIPPRTVDTLQKGDYIEFRYGIFSITNSKGFITKIDNFNIILEDQVWQREYIMLTSEPIPHELFEYLIEIRKE